MSKKKKKNIKYKDGVRQYNHQEKSHVRDFWIVEQRNYNGAYTQKNKKKEIPRDKKYKEDFSEC